MDEGAGDLMINFTTGRNSDLSQRQKVTGNRGQRIRARRAEKFRESLEKQSQNHQESVVQDDEIADSEVKGRESGDCPGVPLKTKGSVISSLFNRNPEIPRVPKAENVNAAKEEVFSSDSFRTLDLHPYMVSNLEDKMGLKRMTSVQCKSIHVLLSGKDALIRSQTGSGKTLAYAIPMVQTLQSLSPKVQRSDGPYAVVLVPTRELAIQSQETFHKLVQPFVWIVPGCVIGGEKRKAEKARLRKGVNIVIATPGRLLDHIEHTHCLKFSRVRWLVLDEADRLLDMGYEKDVARVITALNARSEQPRQTVMLSATLSQGVERLAGLTLNSPERISVRENETQGSTVSGKGDNKGKPTTDWAVEEDRFSLPDKLKQLYVIVPCKLRLVTLASFILWKCKFTSPKSKMIVFLATQDLVEFHHRIFDEAINERSSSALDSGMDSDSEADALDDPRRRSAETAVQFFKLHGEMQQKERTRVYQEFSQADCGVLLCTDVAARGLDLPKVRWIVQFSSPGGCAEYIHRVGRTARAGAQGHSLLFLMPDEVEYIKTLNAQNISLSELPMEDILKSLFLHFRDVPQTLDCQRDIPRTFQEAATYFQLRMEEDLQSNKDLLRLSQKAYQSFVKAYATYPAQLKSIFHVKNLHLGHLAKSFAMRETPKDIGIGVSKIMASSKHKKKRTYSNNISFRDASPPPVKKARAGVMSEFSSGTQGARKALTGPGVRKRKMKKRK